MVSLLCPSEESLLWSLNPVFALFRFEFPPKITCEAAFMSRSNALLMGFPAVVAIIAQVQFLS